MSECVRCVSLSDLNAGTVYRTRSGYAVVVHNSQWTTIHQGCEDHRGYAVRYLDNTDQDIIPRCHVTLTLQGSHEIDQFLHPEVPMIAPEPTPKPQPANQEVLVKADLD